MLIKNSPEVILFSDGLHFILLGMSISTRSKRTLSLTQMLTLSRNVTHPNWTFGAAMLEIPSSTDRFSLLRAQWLAQLTLTCLNCLYFLILNMKTRYFNKMPPPPNQFAKILTDCLNERFHNRWMAGVAGKSGHLDFQTCHLLVYLYFWGQVKQNVYNKPIRSVHHLKHWIQESSASVNPEILQNVWGELEYRLKRMQSDQKMAHT